MKRLLPLLIALLILATLPAGAGNDNPIRLEGQIRLIEASGEVITIRLHRDKDPLIARPGMRVRSRHHRGLRASDLEVGDHIRVSGEQGRNAIYVETLELLRRDIRR